MQLRIVLFFISLVSLNNLFGQCTGCDFTAPAGGTNYNLSGNQTLCIDGTADNLNITLNGMGNTICVNNGSTFTLSPSTTGGILSGVDVEVYGTLIMTSNFNFNSPVNINIHPDGVMDFEGNSFNSNNLSINNDGCLNFTNTGLVSLTNIKIVNGVDSKLDATATTKVDFVGGELCNSGIMEFIELENNEGEMFHNKPTGELYFADHFYNHGSFHNEGYISVGNGLRVGNKGPGKEFLNDGCLCITGDVLFEGPVFNNNIMRIASGDLNINNMVTGIDGQMILEDGISTIEVAGSYAGTNFTFCDQNTTGNDFDVVHPNAVSLNMYTVDCTGAMTACGCGAPVCVTPPAPVLDVLDNTCSPNVDGLFSVLTDCAAGSTIEFSTDGGLTFSASLPTYDPTTSITVEGRCVNDLDPNCFSVLSAPVTSTPTACCPNPNCFGLTSFRN